MKKVVRKETVIWSVFVGHAIIVFSLFVLHRYKGFDTEEFNEFFWYLYPVLLFWGYKTYRIVINEYSLVLPSRALKVLLFLMSVMQLFVLVKALASGIVNFSELKSITLFIELIICVYLFFKIIEADALEEHKLTENGL